MSDPSLLTAASRPRRLFQLDDLTIDPGTAEVRRGDQLLSLPRLSFDLLLALVKAAPDLVTIDELMKEVWPGVVVNAETVSQRVKLLRVALGDDPRRPRYIAVSRGRGYRLLPPVTSLGASTTPAVLPTPTAAPTAPRHKLPRWRWFIGAAVLLLAALAGAFFLKPQRAQHAATTTLPTHSVAVLPFDNLGHSPEDAALAFGVAETLLHRLSSSKDLTVIARQSSFSFAPRGADVRDIGRALNARYLVEGSLQSTSERLRITAQLIDASTGGHVWSLQFDRKPEDIFVIQDEIAARVSEAMRITLSDPTPTADRGTQDFDAYLAHAQGRARMATGREADAKLAIADFERAIRIDPKFARAYAGLAEARYFVADSEMSRDRGSNIDKVLAENEQLLTRALAMDEHDADTHLQLANLYWEGERAEKALARTLELNPNSTDAYALLASMRLFRDRRPDDAIIAIDKARTLSPLEVRYDNEKALLALYGKSDVKLAEQLSLTVLSRDPSSTVALWRLGELYWCCSAQPARGIKYLEQALQQDPDFEFGRRILMRAYLDLDDPAEAEAIAASAPHPVKARLVPILAHARDWTGAATRAYEEERLGTAQAIDTVLRVLALRIHARTTRDFARAREYFTTHSGVRWDAAGQPSLPSTWMPDSALGLADMLQQMGERDAARKLLEVTLASIDDEAHARGRGEFWYLRALPAIYTMLGRDDDALTALEKEVAQHHMPALRLFLTTDPAYERLRSQPRFRAVVEQVEVYTAAQRRELDDMRSKGLLPQRAKR